MMLDRYWTVDVWHDEAFCDYFGVSAKLCWIENNSHSNLTYRYMKQIRHTDSVSKSEILSQISSELEQAGLDPKPILKAIKRQWPSTLQGTKDESETTS